MSGGKPSAVTDSMLLRYKDLHERYTRTRKVWLTPQLLHTILLEFFRSYSNDAKLSEYVTEFNGKHCRFETTLEEFLRFKVNRDAAEKLVQGITSAALCKMYFESSRVEWIVQELEFIQELMLKLAVALQNEADKFKTRPPVGMSLKNLTLK